jgi:hypothetical protein
LTGNGDFIKGNNNVLTDKIDKRFLVWYCFITKNLSIFIFNKCDKYDRR